MEFQSSIRQKMEIKNLTNDQEGGKKSSSQSKMIAKIKIVEILLKSIKIIKMVILPILKQKRGIKAKIFIKVNIRSTHSLTLTTM